MNGRLNASARNETDLDPSIGGSAHRVLKKKDTFSARIPLEVAERATDGAALGLERMETREAE